MAQLEGKTIAVLATNGFEDSELMRPLEALKDNGATALVISEDAQPIKGKNGTEVAADMGVDDADSTTFDGLMLPGGVANPDKLRMNEKAVQLVREFFDQHKPVAAICHGPWMLVEADVVRGRTLTSWPSLKTDIRNAGGTWVDEEVVTDQGLVTSRKPDDLDAFCAKMVEEFAEGEHVGQVA